jgi:putative ABC transport system ATP-binding protein
MTHRSGLMTPPPRSERGLIVEAVGLSRVYDMGSHVVEALTDVDLGVRSGTMVAVRGRSGSGKTTLLNLLGGLDRPTSGRVLVDGEDLTTMDDDQLVEVRRVKVGFIFQAFGLIPILTARENVQVPLRLTHTDVEERETRSRALLELVGLGDRGDHRPHELSGGEQQRVAIARALANTPRVILADEPTGQLDTRTGQTIVELIRTLIRSEHVAVVIATHDPAPLAIADTVVELRDGRIVSRG